MQENTDSNPPVIDIGELEEIHRIFVPRIREKVERVYQGRHDARFAHYTSAEAALNIIGSKRLWMRNAQRMADHREIEHGFEILSGFFDEPKREAFSNAIDAAAPGAALKAFELFGAWLSSPSTILSNAYITSISEHATDESEDAHGRPFMWSSFGDSSLKVALVLRLPYFMKEIADLGLTFGPVAYLSEEMAQQNLHRVMLNIIDNRNREFLKSIDPARVIFGVFIMLLINLTCLKRSCFHGEMEWRAIHAPNQMASSLIESGTETIRGVQEVVYKVPLEGPLALSKIFNRVIIGPRPDPEVMREAFVAALAAAGISDANERVFVSNIPLRA